jgi:hypothetical protein
LRSQCPCTQWLSLGEGRVPRDLVLVGPRREGGDRLHWCQSLEHGLLGIAQAATVKNIVDVAVEDAPVADTSPAHTDTQKGTHTVDTLIDPAVAAAEALSALRHSLIFEALDGIKTGSLRLFFSSSWPGVMAVGLDNFLRNPKKHRPYCEVEI